MPNKFVDDVNPFEQPDPAARLVEAGRKVTELKEEIRQLDNVGGLLDSIKITSEGKKDATSGGNDK